jgi:hypothetical protein
MDRHVLHSKHKVPRPYSQAEEIACSFAGPQDDEFTASTIDSKVIDNHATDVQSQNANFTLFAFATCLFCDGVLDSPVCL